jgi:hypothetical protein
VPEETYHAGFDAIPDVEHVITVTPPTTKTQNFTIPSGSWSFSTTLTVARRQVLTAKCDGYSSGVFVPAGTVISDVTDYPAWTVSASGTTGDCQFTLSFTGPRGIIQIVTASGCPPAGIWHESPTGKITDMYSCPAGVNVQSNDHYDTPNDWMETGSGVIS